jgi:glucose-6-phosphate isomerase
VSTSATPPLQPFTIRFGGDNATLEPQGPTLQRRMSDLEGLFADRRAWERAVADGDPVVYTVVSSPVPEVARELPQSITTIFPGDTGGEFWMTKGHQHPDPQGEIYLGLEGRGGLLLFDGERAEWLDITPGVIGYIPPGWAHRSVNVGDQPYRFLAVYPGSAGHDYGWVLTHGMGLRARRSEATVEEATVEEATVEEATVELVPFGTPAGTAGPAGPAGPTARLH